MSIFERYLENHAKSLISLYGYTGGTKRERRTWFSWAETDWGTKSANPVENEDAGQAQPVCLNADF